MTDLFIDTSGWASLFDRKQGYHREAVHFLKTALSDEVGLVTTNLVLIELTALLTSPLKIPRPQQIQLLADLRSRANLRIVFVDSQMEIQAWNLWQARPDKTWSMVDCTSFVLMQNLKLSQSLTTDHHFEQAGFVRMLQ